MCIIGSVNQCSLQVRDNSMVALGSKMLNLETGSH